MGSFLSDGDEGTYPKHQMPQTRWWISVAGWTGPPKIDPKTYLLVHSLSDLQKVGISEPVASVQDENSLRRS